MPLKRCLSPHVPLAQLGHERLTWLEPRTGERVRVKAWTCDCRATVYELCTAGGQGFIRRTLQREGSPEVHETHRWTIPQTYEMWAAVLSGMAR